MVSSYAAPRPASCLEKGRPLVQSHGATGTAASQTRTQNRWARGQNLLTLYVYIDTIYSGYCTSFGEILVGWTVTAQYCASANLAVVIDTQSGNEPADT